MNNHVLKPLDSFVMQICPYGEVPAKTISGQPIVQVFDEQGFTKVVDDFNKIGKDVRVDLDHASELTDNTEAAGWIIKLRVDKVRGLLGTLRVTDLGAEVLNNQRYRECSPVFEFGDDDRPVRLSSLALTNRPRIKNLEKVWNMDEAKETLIMENEEIKEETVQDPVQEPVETVVNSDEKKEEPKDETVQEPAPEAVEEKPAEEAKEEPAEDKTVNSGMDDLKSILGLPPEATDDDVKNAVSDLLSKVKETLDMAAKEEAKKVCSNMGVPSAKLDEVAEAYMRDPELAKTILNSFEKPQAQKMVCNAAEAEKPELSFKDKLRAEYNSLPGGKKKLEFLRAHRGEL